MQNSSLYKGLEITEKRGSIMISRYFLFQIGTFKGILSTQKNFHKTHSGLCDSQPARTEMFCDEFLFHFLQYSKNATELQIERANFKMESNAIQNKCGHL
jgi:hypothetical protein